jgi:dipeptidyl aminopeptidase/acylaminoacyl peptidase
MKALNINRIAMLALALAAFSPSVVAKTDTGPGAPMSAEDLITLERLGGSAVAPDGKVVVWQATHSDPVTFARSRTLWARPLDGANGEPIKLDFDGDVSDPAFAPNGTLYFLASAKARGAATDAAKTVQLWSVRLDARGAAIGSPALASQLKTDAGGFKIAPDGKHVAVWGEVGRVCPTFGGCGEDGDTSHPGPGSGRLFRNGSGFVRHWDSWMTPGKYNRVFAFDLDAQGRVSGAGRALDGDPAKGGLIGDAPTRPFGDGGEIGWSADSKAVVFTARKADAQEPTSTNLDLWWAPIDGSAPRNLTLANPATDSTPAFSPDGKWLAWTAMARPGYEADRLVVWLRNLTSGEIRALTQGWDRSPTSLAWSRDSKSLFATAEDVLDTPIFRIDAAIGAATRLSFFPGREGNLGDVTVLADGRLVFKRDSIEGPAELYVAKIGGKPKRLTDLDASRLAALAPVVTRRFNFKGAAGDTVWGQITKPANSGKLPALLYVHGGPQGSFNDAWSNRWNPRVVASQGYAVVSVDFHGSTGYGQAFTDAIRNDWGGKPLEDLKLGFAAAGALDPAIDIDNACAMGASYGGYMMNWIEGQWADKFKCIVQHDGVFDARAMAYETEELWFDEWEHGGHPYYEAPEAFEKWNPVNHVDKWRTPMLVITSENDFRIPYTQGLAAFTAAQRRGVPSELLVFPDENHWVLKPKNSLQWHRTVFAWLSKWLHTEQATK